jgi:hypothetical protein
VKLIVLAILLVILFGPLVSVVIQLVGVAR